MSGTVSLEVNGRRFNTVHSDSETRASQKITHPVQANADEWLGPVFRPTLDELRNAWGQFQPPQQFAYLCDERQKDVRNQVLADPKSTFR